ncbi:MAG: glycosyltransferase family 4 protein [Patescibacteria group bacterium]|nr:glycosyltransferase family 4 protein [Patescibacteria group bacterium]
MNKINQILDTQQSIVRTIFVSSYIPRKCGLATFTKDLTNALNDLNSESLAEIIAINDGEGDLEYPWEVKYKIHQDKYDSYYQAAEYVNQSSADVVCLQHEFGLFGGEAGEYIFAFLRNINKPIITIFHTILAQPTDIQRSTLQRLGEISDSVVAMIPDAKERLERDYNIDRDKVVTIHHGVSDQKKASSQTSRLNWKEKPVLLLSGLISENKGIEYVIKALPQIIKEFPDISFIIAGQTHPEILKRQGEKYRKSLQKLANTLKVSKNIKFINKYLELQELLNLYEKCDIYLTPHIDPEQITSGTLAYALGMGKACISTGYPYAKEMLADNRGVIVDFKSSEQIAEAVLKILKNPSLKAELEEEAYVLGRKMRWPRVAERYLNLFRYVSSQK